MDKGGGQKQKTKEKNKKSKAPPRCRQETATQVNAALTHTLG
jgi:hypothetical protein